MKTVLCAIDINQPEFEANVLSVAAQQADFFGAGLDVITVIPDYGTSAVAGFFEKKHEKEAISRAKDLLNQTVSDTLGENSKLEIRNIVASGSVYEKILKTASTTKAELIVIGSHKPNFQDYFLGPNAVLSD